MVSDINSIGSGCKNLLWDETCRLRPALAFATRIEHFLYNPFRDPSLYQMEKILLLSYQLGKLPGRIGIVEMATQPSMGFARAEKTVKKLLIRHWRAGVKICAARLSGQGLAVG